MPLSTLPVPWRILGLPLALTLLTLASCTDRDSRSPIAKLPLIEVAASGNNTDALAIIVTGDGGWAKLVRRIGQRFADAGVPVIALSAPRYYWTPRTPDESAAALAEIIRWFVKRTGHQRVLLVGYSRGADVLPFMVNRLPSELNALIELTALIGPEPHITFELRLTDLIPFQVHGGLPVRPEILKLDPTRVLCIFGMQEKDSVCPGLPPDSFRLAAFPGGHHFNQAYDQIAERILDEFAMPLPTTHVQ